MSEDTLTAINQKLAALRAEAAQINSAIHAASTKEDKKSLTNKYMALSAQISALKAEKTQIMAAAPQPSGAPANKEPSVKLATLTFSNGAPTKYFATTDNIVDLLITLKETFEDDAPAVTSFFGVPPDQVSKIPQHWFELVDEREHAAELIEKNGFPLARIVGPSKSAYKTENPNNIVVFNANIAIPKGKVWYGDLDLTKDADALQKIANELGSELLIFRENDLRFENENVEEIRDKAVQVFAPLD